MNLENTKKSTKDTACYRNKTHGKHSHPPTRTQASPRYWTIKIQWKTVAQQYNKPARMPAPKTYPLHMTPNSTTDTNKSNRYPKTSCPNRIIFIVHAVKFQSSLKCWAKNVWLVVVWVLWMVLLIWSSLWSM